MSTPACADCGSTGVLVERRGKLVCEWCAHRYWPMTPDERRETGGAISPDGPCDSCGNPFTAGQRWIYHARLNVYVHEPCAAGGVRGEDITTQAVTMGQVPGPPTVDTH